MVQKLDTEGLRAACECVNVALGLDEDIDELEDKVVEALNQFKNNNVIEIDVSDLQKPTIKTY